MLQIGCRTSEELLIVAWTGVLTWLTTCRWFPDVCDLMTDRRLIGFFVALDMLIILLAEYLSKTRYGTASQPTKLPPSALVTVRITHWFKTITLMRVLRVLLAVTLPMSGVMCLLDPASEGAMGLIKKLLVLEEKLWSRWCPESYIMLGAICCIVFVARRTILSSKHQRHDPFLIEEGANFYHPSPAGNYGLS